MALHRLPAGTDVAEMALFDVESLPPSRSLDSEGLDALVARERLIRLPTDGDGGYLLHLYVDEPPPAQIMRFCVVEDKLVGRFSTAGRIAFGGVESACQDFKPNRLIRSDTVIRPGSYALVAYRTDIPDKVVTKTIEVASTCRERWLDRAPLIVTLASLGLAFVFAIRQNFLAAAVVLVARYLSVEAIKRIPGQAALAARREKAQSNLPSIVIEMRSI